MSNSSTPIIVLPGAGGGCVDTKIFQTSADGLTRFETICYPGWRRYIEYGFSADELLEDLTAEMTRRVPEGPVRIVGVSLGGPIGYAAALRLQASGRNVEGFCAIDPFVVTSTAPRPDWKGRALKQGSQLLRGGRLRDFAQFLRCRFWRALLRLGGAWLPRLFRRLASSGRLPRILAIDPLFEGELSMRLLMRAMAPWIPSLEREPIALRASSVLLRTRETSCDDALWRRRCPGIEIVEIPGDHQTLFDPGNVGPLREAFVSATREWR